MPCAGRPTAIPNPADGVWTPVLPLLMRFGAAATKPEPVRVSTHRSVDLSQLA